MFDKAKVYLFMGLYMIACLSYASPFHPVVEVNTLSTEQTEVTFHLPEIKITDISEHDMSFQSIEIEGAFVGGDTGLPDLPHFSATIAVPIGSKVFINNVKMSETRYINNITAYPVQNYQNKDRTFDFDMGFYLTKDPTLIYPTQTYFITETQTMRDIDFVTVKIYPIQYRPATNTLEIVDYISISVSHLSENPHYYHTPKISKSFERMYEHIISNYQQVRTPNPVYQEPSILIIYGGNNHTQAFNTHLNNIITIKKQKGFWVEAVGTNTIGNTTSTIRNYIQNAYNSSPHPPEWVVIIGGVSDGTFIVPYYSLPGNGDFEYTRLSANNDQIGDVFIGRISIASDNDLDNYYRKLLKYEVNTIDSSNPLNNQWLNKTLIVGDPAESGVSCVIISRYITALLSEYDPAHNITEIYQGHPSAYTMVNLINAGLLTFNFRGIQYMSGLVNQIGNLSNQNTLPNCIFITCGTGHFDNNARHTEEITRKTYQNQPSGALTAIGMSAIHTHTAYNNTMNGGIAYSMYTADASSMGEALLFGKTFLHTVYPQTDSYSFPQLSIRWANLLGDPSAQIYKTIPKTFDTVIPSSIPTGTQALRFVVTDSEGQTVPDAFVVITNGDGTYLTKAISDAAGVAYVSLDPELSGALIVCISKPNFYMKRQILQINPQSQSVSVTDYMTYDPAPNGNNNLSINPGETINLSIMVTNFSDANIDNLTATISSDSEYFSQESQDAIQIGTVSPRQQAWFEDAFTFAVSPITADKILLPLCITISDGSTEWVSYLLPEVKGVDLNIVSMSVIAQNYVNIGSETNVYFNLKNMGTAPAHSFSAELISMSDYCTVSPQTAFLGDEDAQANLSNQNTPFQITVTSNAIPGIQIPVKLRLFNSDGYETFIPYTIGVSVPVGIKLVTDPTGPDDYGYMILDHQDTIQHDLKAYDWVEISTIGTDSGLVDLTPTGEEAMVIKYLPFTAKYYGVDYDRISICSNGFFVFGQTEQRNFRNLPIPGPIVPKAMVAPYWTDIVTGGTIQYPQNLNCGKVYTYYHSTQHAYIIQWHQVRLVTGYSYANYFSVSNYTVTFQALIYDSAYYPTPTGDNLIKFQYQTFHPGVSGSDTGPINFITVGMQDQTGTRGIQYAYNNVYSPGSRTLANNSALLLTYFDEMSTINDITESAPRGFTVEQNYPNPFNPSTNISFYIAEDSRVNVTVYNIKGQQVKCLIDEYLLSGNHTLQWHGNDERGGEVGSGIYFIRVSDGKYSAVKKAVLLK